MNTARSLQQLEALTKHYLQELEDFSIEELKRQPSDEEWSLGQMYLHLINASSNLYLRNIQTCMTTMPSAEESADKTEAGQAIFDQGGFPPVRIRVPPSPQYTPEQPGNKEQLVEGLTEVLSRMKRVAPKLDETNPHHTVRHSRLGALTAKEWFLLTEMHYRHHLLQKDRLKAFLDTRKEGTARARAASCEE